jgi:hypothetical protein
MPTSVARTGANLPNGNFLPEVWSKKLQAKFYASTSLDNVTNHDWEGEIKNQGSKVQIRVRPTVNIGDYTVNGDISYQDLGDDKITLTIDKAKYFAFKVDDIDQAQADIKVMNEASMDAAENMKIVVEQQVYGSVFADATSVVTATQVTKTNVLDHIVDLGTTLDELNVPTSGRWLVVPPWLCGLIKKSDLKDASLSGDGSSILRKNGDYVGDINGFSIHKSNNLSGTGATSAVPTHCLAGTRHAICFASQFVKTETLRLQNTFGDAIRGLNVYGFLTTKPQALIDARFHK